MTFTACDSCPVKEGACYPRRAGLRRMCEVPAYRDQVEQLGGDLEPAQVAAFTSHTDAAREQLVADLAWFAGLGPEIKDGIERCVHRKAEAGVSCCGGDGFACRGGSRDGQVVKILDCARCMTGRE